VPSKRAALEPRQLHLLHADGLDRRRRSDASRMLGGMMHCMGLQLRHIGVFLSWWVRAFAGDVTCYG
jgi:hypothetical protein